MLRSRVLCWAFTVSLIASTTSVWSQGAGGGRGFGMRGLVSDSEFGIIEMPAVQKELSLTDEQKAKVKELCTAFQQASRPEFPGGRPTPGGGEEMRKALAESATKAEQFTKEKKPELLAVLNAEQKTRLSEIRVQVLGFAAYLQPEVQEKLGLTAEQVEKVTALQNEYSPKLRQLASMGRRSQEEAQKAQKDRQALVRERAEAVEKVLTPAQLDKFQALNGKPFDLAALQGPRG
jgi:Spy/CpxP family protein refolding chaperone